MPRVSVIIPVYNAAKYLDECIRSLLAQTEPSCEFVFVDDGSKDESANIIRGYAGNDERIIVIAQENQGVSAARNAGVAAASGEFLGFVDADDFIEPDMYEKLWQCADEHHADIVISDYYSEQGKAKLRIGYEFPAGKVFGKDAIGKRILPYFISKDLLNSACNKIFRREMIVRAAIGFPVGVALGEDAIFNMRAFDAAASAVYLDHAGYHYREVQGSATRNTSGHDYFGKAIDAFKFDYASVMKPDLSPSEIQKLKSLRLVNNVLSLVHLYFDDTSSKLGSRFASVRRMVSNAEVQKIFSEYPELVFMNRSRYSSMLLKMIRDKQIYGLYLATLYSKFRNR